MALPVHRPFYEVVVDAQTTSIGTTPVAGIGTASASGYLQRVMANAGGTTTGTITVAVTINGGSDVANSTLTIAAGTGARNNPAVELALNGAGSTSGVYVNEGDCFTFTPSGGTGSSIPGSFAAVIRVI